MRILHVISSLDPAGGGPPSVLWRLAAAQAALGHDVTAVGARAPDRDGVVEASRVGVVGGDRVSVLKADRPPGRVAAALGSRVVDAVRAAPTPDIVHMHGVWDVPLLRTARWCRARGVPYVVRPAGMLDVWTLRQRAAKKKIALALAYRRMLDRAGAIHALNAHERDTVADLGFASPIEVIPNGVFLEEIERPGDPADFRAEHPALGDRPYALFLSRLHFKKGLDILAEAWARVAPEFPEHRLVLVGPREDDSIDDFRARVERAGVAGSVVEAGAVYGALKPAAFRGAECFVLPSRQEGFSVAITEALALGVPAVVSRDCHFPEISEVGAGVETSLDPEDVAGALRRVLADEGFRRRASEAGRTLVRERFTWPRIARETLALYARLTPNTTRS
jgi:glycosyltransferase involved in cell wall biosynthesis